MQQWIQHSLISFRHLVCLAVAVNCAVNEACAENGTASLLYHAGSLRLPDRNEPCPFAASPGGDATLVKGKAPVLLTKDLNPQNDGRYYWLTRAEVEQLLDAHDGAKLTVVCDVAVSTGHIAATSVRLFVPGNGFQLGPLRRDVHRAGYQDVIATGHQIGFSLVSDGKNHERDEVLLIDFGPEGPHRILGSIRVPVHITRTYVLAIRPSADDKNDRMVVLTAEDPEASPSSVAVKLSEFSPNATPTNFGLVFGHLTGGGTAEAKWREIRLQPEEASDRTEEVADHVVLRPIGSRRQLFVDNWLIAEMSHLQRLQGQPIKSENNPVLRRDRPWEASRCELYGSSIWNPDTQNLQLFYSAMKQPYDSRVAYAESEDFGESWNKPVLDQFLWEGKPSNIVWPGRYWAHGPCVLYDAEETDPNKRYKMLVTAAALDPHQLDQGKRGMDAAFSPDGIHWTAAENNPVINDFVSDTGNCVVWDADRNIYRAYVRLRTNVGRAVGLAESPDFLHWSEPRLIYWPTDADASRNQEFYGLSVTPYGDIYIGLVWIFPSVPASSDMQSDSPVTWPELVVNRDGERWERPFPGQPFLPLGPKGSFDARQIRPA